MRSRTAFLLIGLLLAGCGRRTIHLPVVENLRPLVRLTYAPAGTDQPSYYACEFYWIASDPDGAVDHYVYCLDPPTRAGADTSWIATTDNRVRFVLHCDDTEPPGTLAEPVTYHVFVLKAIDNLGASSVPVIDAFTAFTLAPTVTILEPRYTHGDLIWPTLPPSTTFTFTGVDADGRNTRFPVLYKYKLYSSAADAADFHAIAMDPDTLRRRYAPAFADWDSIAGDTCRVPLRSLAPATEYIFAVVAFDEAGAYSPVFSMGTSLFRFACSYTGRSGPRLSLWNEFFSYRYMSGGYNPDPTTAIQVEVPSGRVIDFQWSAAAPPGADMRSYRWALDIGSLDDETPRSSEASDWNHWSRPSLAITSCLLGPFAGAGGDSAEYHTLYLEAEDSNGLKSLGMVRFRVSRPSFSKDILFVNDTRLTVDAAKSTNPDSTVAPGGLWPTEAELDTFLYARGGVRWRCYLPLTTLSPHGIFNGYHFDTIGTRRFGGLGTIPLWVLGAYRHIVWIGDPALTYNSPTTHPKTPMPLLRNMYATPVNALSVYTGMGGSLWMLGGGVATNSLLPYNQTSNDHRVNWQAAYPVFAGATGELVMGRMMYDLAHWRSEISVMNFKSARLNSSIARWPGAPDYSVLPAQLVARTDPVPPMRTINSFTVTSFFGEALTLPNYISEEMSDDPAESQLATTLDTLYYGIGGDFAGRYTPAIMTYYHGRETSSMVFCGFPLWYFQRAQAIQLGDFVLQKIWGLPRDPLPR